MKSRTAPPRQASRGGRRRASRLAVARVGVALVGAALAAGGCAREDGVRDAAEDGPSRGTDQAPIDAVLLVTLDTTRADRLGYAGAPVATPHLDRLAAEGVRYERAYTTAPMTLPAHASMLTGLLPYEHGIHENSRRLAEGVPVLAELLAGAGWRTAAFVSGLPLGRQFGLARGFATYDDDLGEGVAERRADATTDRAIAAIAALEGERAFVWVHYFDPHEPYDPPAPFRERYADDPYLGEIAFMDAQLGRLLSAFEAGFADAAHRIVVAGDHGEGLGDHGEAYHGNLVYDPVMRVPMLVAGSGVSPAIVEAPVSVRHLFDSVLRWARIPRPGASGAVAGSGLPLQPGEPAPEEVVVAEGMRPYLQYGWQPQVMGVLGTVKAIRAGDLEVYDLAADPAESRDLAGELALDPRLERALSTYPIPGGRAEGDLDAQQRAALASLGYVTWEGEVALQEDAPSPREMVHVFDDLDLGSGLFVRGEYARAIPVFARVAAQDPRNLMVLVRLAVAHSLVGEGREAERLFARAAELRPDSVDVRHYRAMHLLRSGRWAEAEALFEEVLRAMPDRLPALAALAGIRERQGRVEEAIRLYERIVGLEARPAPALLRLGDLRMERGETAAALRAFERARSLTPSDFERHLELGVLYLAERRLDEAAEALDAVAPDHPGAPMALFKRAQVAVLRAEPDAAERVRRAWRAADDATAPLIRSERLFRDFALDP
ncbi:MAG TPA: sulfatase-like hydrolase/transferase [Thermoanaerobaculia bacterium]|nr:sulfatase-like hydrolase/transferase [Thermoanaerobaculia bacterium]